MSTSKSPLRKLQAQADKTAAMLKAASRGEGEAARKMAGALLKESVKFAVVMDDKTLIMELRWNEIRELSESGIAAYILKYMRDNRDSVH